MDHMTAKVSCFARAYHHKNNQVCIFDDPMAKNFWEMSMSRLQRTWQQE